MKILAVLLQLMLIAGPILSAEVDAPAVPEKEEQAKVKRSAFALKPKSRVVGVTLSIVPGFLIHGTGHHYAKKHRTALILHAVEATAVALLAFGISGGYDEFKDIDENIPTNLYSLTKYEAMMVGGLVLFFSGWLYDIFGTPKAVADYNATLSDQDMETSGYEPGAAQRTSCLSTGFSLAGLDTMGVAR